jgi:UDP-N-acetylmuramate: L-alanyl-gamma-D-glutamyl-meso-diaminopimelate ligase
MDHADIYRDFDTVKLQFCRWVNIIPCRSLLLVNGDNEGAVEVVRKALCRVERFGEAEGSDWRIVDLRDGPTGTTFDLATPRGRVAEKRPGGGGAVDRSDGTAGARPREASTIRVALPTAGAFNARNAVAAIASAVDLGVSLPRAVEAMASFPGVRRRLEVRGEAGGVTVVDDFAHHPTAIQETIRAARSRWPGRRLVVVLEPRSWSLRRRIFQDELPAALSGADLVVVASVYRGEDLPETERLDVGRLVRDIAAHGVAARQSENAVTIVTSLAPDLRPGDVVLVMSNGGFGGLHDRLLAAMGS